jgi:hypothetical protein
VKKVKQLEVNSVMNTRKKLFRDFTAYVQNFHIKVGRAALGWNFYLVVGGFILDRNFDINIGRAARETGSTAWNFDRVGRSQYLVDINWLLASSSEFKYTSPCVSYIYIDMHIYSYSWMFVIFKINFKALTLFYEIYMQHEFIVNKF